ncbi:MAG TPA: acyltransferase [Limnobacter sp.]|uniref:acyltransferase family protein n=1 Tax=Limnobacter sp. TaxID=2003368 RepID=UPI002ED79C5A
MQFTPTSRSDWPALHGARALSILLVLACHLLPLGPKTVVDLNIAAGQLGMSIFFALSAFLITHKLHTEPSLTTFAINRFFRIVPLVWLVLLIDFAWRLLSPAEANPSWPAALAHLGFWVNNQPDLFLPETHHLWSLCVEVQFYILAGLAFTLGKRKGLWMLVFLGVLLALHRALIGNYFNTTTPYRLDEILIPLMVGLYWHQDGPRPAWVNRIKGLNPWFALLALAVSCLAPPIPWLFPLRPLLGSLFIASLLLNPNGAGCRIFSSSHLRWVSEHSYALYALHPFLQVTWLGSGDKWAMYLKRPLLLLAAAGLALLSARTVERQCIQLGRWFNQRLRHRQNPTSAQSVHASHDTAQTKSV